MMSPEDIAKDPKLAPSYRQYIQKREEYFNKTIQPAIDNRDRLANRITMGTDLKQWGDVKVRQGG